MANRIFPNVEPTPEPDPHEPPQPDGVTAALALIVGNVAYRIIADRHIDCIRVDIQSRTITCPGLVWLSDMKELADELAGEGWQHA